MPLNALFDQVQKDQGIDSANNMYTNINFTKNKNYRLLK